jgi:hypothetical protein
MMDGMEVSKERLVLLELIIIVLQQKELMGRAIS